MEYVWKTYLETMNWLTSTWCLQPGVFVKEFKSDWSPSYLRPDRQKGKLQFAMWRIKLMNCGPVPSCFAASQIAVIGGWLKAHSMSMNAPKASLLGHHLFNFFHKLLEYCLRGCAFLVEMLPTVKWWPWNVCILYEPILVFLVCLIGWKLTWLVQLFLGSYRHAWCRFGLWWSCGAISESRLRFICTC